MLLSRHVKRENACENNAILGAKILGTFYHGIRLNSCALIVRFDGFGLFALANARDNNKTVV